MTIRQPELHVDHPVLSTAVDAAMQAAVIIERYFHQGAEVRDKGVGELVTSADLDAERAIVGIIRNQFPGHHIMAEEGHQAVVENEHLWVVDPLDGTNNFAHRIPHFAVSIGYYHHGIPECGVIVNPMTNEWYIAVRGQGAWYQGKPAHVNHESRLDQSLIAIGFYYDRGAMMEATLLAVRDLFRKNIHGVRRFGTASLDLGQVGRGLFGAYFEYRLLPWDHAAGRLFVEEAGGQVTDCNGSTIEITQPTSILASNGKLHAETLAVVLPPWQQYTKEHPQ
jgi:myo-inositol-1(or 4)-monophosphatase